MTNGTAQGDADSTGLEPTLTGGVEHSFLLVDGAVDDAEVRRLVEQVAQGLRDSALPDPSHSVEVEVTRSKSEEQEPHLAVRVDIHGGDEAVDAVSDYLDHWGEWLREQGNPLVTGISAFEGGSTTWYLRPGS